MRSQVVFHSFGYLTRGRGVTIAVSLAGIALGFVLGAAACMARLSGRPWLAAGGAYISVFRGVPLLVQLLFVYYFLAKFGLDIPALVAAIGGLGCVGRLSGRDFARRAQCGAARAERGGDGAGLPLEVWRRILLPQALRISVPPLINEFILLLKASSLVSVVGIAELTRVSMNIASMTYRPLEAYLGGGLFYLAINLCLAGLGALAERSSPEGAR